MLVIFDWRAQLSSSIGAGIPWGESMHQEWPGAVSTATVIAVTALLLNGKRIDFGRLNSVETTRNRHMGEWIPLIYMKSLGHQALTFIEFQRLPLAYLVANAAERFFVGTFVYRTERPVRVLGWVGAFMFLLCLFSFLCRGVSISRGDDGEKCNIHHFLLLWEDGGLISK